MNAFVFIFFILLILTIFFLWATKAFKYNPPTPPPDAPFVHVPPFLIHYKQMGKGKSHILLIHGIGSSLNEWSSLSQRLAPYYKLTLVDLPGFGWSSLLPEEEYHLDAQAHRLLEFCQKIYLPPSALVGSSMGAALALWLAYKNPKLFPKVIAISPAIFHHLRFFKPSKMASWTFLFHPIMIFPVAQMMLHLAYSNPQCFVHSPHVQQSRVLYLSTPQASSCFLKATDLIRDPRPLNHLSHIKSHLLFLWGAQDKVNKVKNLKVIQKIRPQDPYAGHQLMQEAPNWCFNKITKFLSDKSLN